MERELDITEAELWEAFDQALQVQPMDEDAPGFKTIIELAEQYSMSPSPMRRKVQVALRAGTLERRKVRRAINSRRIMVWVYRPKPPTEASRECPEARGG